MTDLRDRILASDDLERVEVEVPEWADALNGDRIFARGMTAGEVERFGRAMNEGDTDDVMARIVVQTTVYETGLRVFGDDDVEAVSRKNSGVIKRLFEAAQQASGLEDDHSGN